MKISISALMAVLLFPCALQAQTVYWDTNTTATSVFLYSVGLGDPVGTTYEAYTTASGILGGERDVYAVNVNGDNFGNSVLGRGSATGGKLIANRGPENNATYTYTWDGIDGSSALNATGLGGVDLYVNSTTGLSFDYSADIPGQNWQFIYYTDATNYSSYTFAASAPASLLPANILFSSFTATGGSGADFNNIGAIQIISTSVDSGDGSISNLRITSVVPEASSALLGGLGALALLRRRR